MKKVKNIKLIMFKNCMETETIIANNTEEGAAYIFDLAEKWKKKDTKRNTIRISVDKKQ